MLPSFQLLRPERLSDALAALSADPEGSMLIAGGTDLLPNMKNGLHSPARLISLRHIPELREIRETEDGGVVLGAGCSLATLASHPLVVHRYPALAQAARLVASPQIRNMATLGGNVCLDTRCIYYNQSAFWRDALGHCLKKDGTVCHVVPKGQSCVAAMSADTPTALLSFDARVCLASARGERRCDLDSFYVNDGARNTVRSADEMVVALELPAADPRCLSSYHKLALRKSIDFPLLSIALTLRKDENGAVADIRLAIGAIASRPRLVRGLREICRGRPVGTALVAEVATAARQQCHPLLNLATDPAWRRDVLEVSVRRAFSDLAPSAGSEVP